MKNRSNEILSIFANNLKKYRKQMNLSQEELAFKCDLHRTYIGMIERAEKNITLININVIANALNVPIEKLLEYKK